MVPDEVSVGNAALSAAMTSCSRCEGAMSSRPGRVEDMAMFSGLSEVVEERTSVQRVARGS